MRIGFVIPSLSGGGAELVARRWAATLADQGHEVRAYTFDPAGSPALEVPEAAHAHFPLRSAGSRWLLLPAWIRRRADRDGLEALVSMMTFANLAAVAGASALRGRSAIPVVIVEHSVMTLGLPLQSDGSGARTKRWLARRLYRHASAAIGVSHPVVADMIGGYGVDPSRAFVVPNPVLEAPPAEPEPGLPPAALNVAFVGRLVARKRPLLFVDALAALAARGIEVRGTVVGDGPMRDEVRARGRERGVPLDLRGWTEPWLDAARDVDCLLLPSDVEGLGNVFVEAAAAGIPSVARSSALGPADAIVPGLTGELVGQSGPEHLADGVLRAVSSRGGDPLASWLSRFSAQASAARLLEILGGAAPPGAGAGYDPAS